MRNKGWKGVAWPSEIAKGLKVILPVLLVYIAIGVAFGVIAVENGIAPVNAVLMSAFVYAGTAQLVGVQLIGLGASPLSIVLTTIVINSRFFVMASALAPHLRKLHFWERAAYSAQLTDATFAIHVNRLTKANPSKIELFTTNIVGHAVWIGSSAIGTILGSAFDGLESFAIDYAMPAMFIGLLVPLINDRFQFIVAVAAVIGVVIFYSAGFAFWTTLMASSMAVIFGLGVRRWSKK